jgi:hypothetical protein
MENGFKALGLSDAVYKGTVRLGFRVRFISFHLIFDRCMRRPTVNIIVLTQMARCILMTRIVDADPSAA